MKAIVRNGRLQMDFPLDLPDGTEFELVLDESDGPSLSEADLEKLNGLMQRAAADLDAGRGVDGDAVLARLWAKRS